MNLNSEFVLLIFSLMFFIFSFNRLRYNYINVGYAITWMACSVLLLTFAIFPSFYENISEMLGFEAYSNFIFVVIISIIAILIITLFLTVSKQDVILKSLTQEISLLKSRCDKLEEE